MDAYESRLASVAKTAIEGLVVSRTQGMVNGNARNYEEHKRDVGYLQGLSAALEAIDDAKKTLMAGERV